MEITFCTVEECVALMHKDGLCRGHYERQRKGASLRPPLRPSLGSWGAVVEAVHAYVDADSREEAAFRAARARVQRAMRAWAFAHDRRRGRVRVPAVGR